MQQQRDPFSSYSLASTSIVPPAALSCCPIAAGVVPDRRRNALRFWITTLADWGTGYFAA